MVTKVLFISIFILIIIHFFDIVDLLTDISNRAEWLKQYIYIMQSRLRILNQCHRIDQRCELQCQFC